MPKHIRHHRHYGSCYRGRAYYEPHGHFHWVYYFPSWLDGALSHLPYAYCNGAYFGAYHPDHYAYGSGHGSLGLFFRF